MPADNNKLTLPNEAREKLSEAFAKCDLELLDALIITYVMQDYDFGAATLIGLLNEQDPEIIRWWISHLPDSVKKDYD